MCNKSLPGSDSPWFWETLRIGYKPESLGFPPKTPFRIERATVKSIHISNDIGATITIENIDTGKEYSFFLHKRDNAIPVFIQKISDSKVFPMEFVIDFINGANSNPKIFDLIKN